MFVESLVVLMMAFTPATEAAVQGLWRYRGIASQGEAEVPIDGLFLFQGNRFVQQSLNVGEPFEEQLAQAHSGSFEIDGGQLDLLAEVGIVVDPTKDSPVEYRRDSKHQMIVQRSDDALTLTFGSGTVQKLERVGPGEGQVFVLDRGAFALVDGYFVLVYEGADQVMAGSGAYERRDGKLLLRPERWFSVEDGRATYSRDQIEAILEDNALRVGDGPRVPFKK